MPSSKFWIASCILASASLAPASHAFAQSCSATQADKTAVVDTMRQLYAAATIDDFAKIHAVTAPGFYGFDGGHSYDSIDSLMVPVKAYQDKGVKYIWNVTHPRVTVLCNEAWISYVNDGSFQMPNAAPTPTQWLESAVLEKQHGEWKIVFFHSTRVPSAQPPK